MGSVVDDDVERSGEGDDEFFVVDFSMTATPYAAWHIIEPIGSFDLKGDMQEVLGKRKVASCIQNLGQVDEMGIVDVHDDRVGVGYCFSALTILLQAKPSP